MSTPNPYIVVHQFEEAVAKYCGSQYAVAVESCTAALFLSLMWVKQQYDAHLVPLPVRIPARTYPGVPCSIIHAGFRPSFDDADWSGEYQLGSLNIWDAALRFKKGMYHGGFQCLSFHIKKLIPIGRGGMILTNNFEAVKWLRKARFDGRNPVPLQEDNFDMLGWNMYMQPDQAARGLQLLQALGDRDLPDLEVEKQGYPDLSVFQVYQQPGKFMRLRKMKMQDADFMLELKNYPETREFAIYSHDEIKKEDHYKWLPEKINQFRVIDGYYHDNLGVVRVNGDEISIWVNKRYWGLGIATEIIKRVSNRGMKAKIVDGNVASMKAFIKAGFVPIDHVDNYYILQKQ